MVDIGNINANLLAVQNNVTSPLRRSTEGIANAAANASEAVSNALKFNASAGTSPRGQTNILEVPMDVASGDAALGNHGHYIMFYINEQDKAQLSMSDRASGGSIADDLAKPYGVGSFIRNYSAQSAGYQKQRSNIEQKNLNDNLPSRPQSLGVTSAQAKKFNVEQTLAGGERTAGSTVRVKRRPTKRLSTSIAMYMPQSVQVTYGAQYQDTQIGAITESALNAYNDLISGRGGDAIGHL